MEPYDIIASNSTEALPHILEDLLSTGAEYSSRNGNVYELSPARITLTDPADHMEMTTPGRRASLPAQIAETMWLLAGRDDIEWLSHYLPRAPQFSDNGHTWRGAYGPRIRRWGDVDQLRYVAELLADSPDSRRAVINIYDPSVDSQPGLDVPCNDWLHFLIRDGKLNLHVATRSNDVIWGWSGINSFEWTALLMVMAWILKVEPGSITFSISSLHLYGHHEKKARNIMAAGPPEPLSAVHSRFTVPTLAPETERDRINDLDAAVAEWFTVEDVIREAKTLSQLSDALHLIGTMRVPLFRSWAYALFSHWHGGSMGYFYQGTTMDHALKESPKPKRAAAPAPATAPASDSDGPEARFADHMVKLHTEKSRAYGNSWKKRGEQYSILPNIARKVDRLAGGMDTTDETAADTAVDLFIYLAKYWNFLHKEGFQDGELEAVNTMLKNYAPGADVSVAPEADLEAAFEALLDRVDAGELRAPLVQRMLSMAYRLAFDAWSRAEWKAGNEKRTWKGYNPEDVEELSGD